MPRKYRKGTGIIRNKIYRTDLKFAKMGLSGLDAPIYVCANDGCNNEICTMQYEMSKYAYRIQHKSGTYFFCSYTCMRQFENKNNFKKYIKRG